jgi:hypothetical protein
MVPNFFKKDEYAAALWFRSTKFVGAASAFEADSKSPDEYAFTAPCNGL